MRHLTLGILMYASCFAGYAQSRISTWVHSSVYQVSENTGTQLAATEEREIKSVPMGPYMQYATEKPGDPMEIRIVTGADGFFTLYEDGNDT